MNKTNNINGNKKYDKFEKFDCENFNEKLGKYTFGLDKIIPWEEFNFVFSGGLLYDIITDRFSNDLSDIDLFFYGDSKYKYYTINKILDNLDLNQYNYLIGYVGSVMCIIIQGIPRIIQLIFTDKENASQIISLFDMTHLMFYCDGISVYGNEHAIKSLQYKTTEIIKINPARIIKYYERNIISIYKIYDDIKYFVFGKYDTENYIKNKKQILLYKLTNNLTHYPNNPNSPIYFLEFNKNLIDLWDYFECIINYKKYNNHEFVEDIDMFGKFANYFEENPYNIITGNNNHVIANNNDNNYLMRDNYIYTLSSLYKNTNTQLYECYRFNSFYIRCELLRMDVENDVIKMYYRTYERLIAEILLRIINPDIILNNIESACNCYYDTIGRDKITNFKQTSDVNKKINIPFINSKSFPNINCNVPVSFSDKYGLVFCSKIFKSYITHKFNKCNKYDTLDNMSNFISSNSDPKFINSLFELNIYVKYNADNVDYIDINLVPVHIYIT